jgi:hypothetical protein
MLENHEHDRNKVAIVAAPDETGQCLLIEVAESQGLERWVNGRTRKKVWVRANEEQVVDLLEAMRPAWLLLKLRRLEALTEAVFAAGGKRLHSYSQEDKSSMVRKAAIERLQISYLGEEHTKMMRAVRKIQHGQPADPLKTTVHSLRLDLPGLLYK